MVPQSGSGVRLTLARPRLPPACAGQVSLTRVGHRRAPLRSLGYKVGYHGGLGNVDRMATLDLDDGRPRAHGHEALGGWWPSIRSTKVASLSRASESPAGR